MFAYSVQTVVIRVLRVTMLCTNGTPKVVAHICFNVRINIRLHLTNALMTFN
jgi:hypothetical protein